MLMVLDYFTNIHLIVKYSDNRTKIILKKFILISKIFIRYLIKVSDF